MSSERVLNYAPAFKSFLDTSFFQELSRLKLDVLKLDSTCQPLTVNLDLHNIPKSADQVPLFLTNRSFEKHNNKRTNEVPLQGSIFNFNVLDEFKNLDKQLFLHQRALECWEDGIKDINKCVSFVIISFADLKKVQVLLLVRCSLFSKTLFNSFTCAARAEFKRAVLKVSKMV